jgi:hypothetical protein
MSKHRRPAVQTAAFVFDNATSVEDCAGAGRAVEGAAAAAGVALAPPLRGARALQRRFRFCGCKLISDRASKYKLLPVEFGVVLLQYDLAHQWNVEFVHNQFTKHSLVQVPLTEPYFVLGRVEEIGEVERVRVYDRTTRLSILLTAPGRSVLGGYRELLLWARCAFSDRILHSRMPLDPTHVRFKRPCA